MYECLKKKIEKGVRVEKGCSGSKKTKARNKRQGATLDWIQYESVCGSLIWDN